MLKNVAPMYGGMASGPLLSQGRRVMGDDMESAGSIDIARASTKRTSRRQSCDALWGCSLPASRSLRHEAGRNPYGLTVNSFNSVSLDPPLILWSLDLANDCTKMFRDAGAFAVNVMPAGSETSFAGSRLPTSTVSRASPGRWWSRPACPR